MRLSKNVKIKLVDYFPELDLDDIRIKAGIPWYVPMKVAAYTNCNRIYFARGKYRPKSKAGIALIAHELAHCAQYKLYGAWRFRIMYAGSWLAGLLRHHSFNEAYLQNRFEAEARVIEDRVYDDLSNRFN